jgi:hypothetical protein
MRELRSPLSCAALVVAVLVLTACAAPQPGGAPGPAVAAPTLRVGDRWTYQGTDGYRVPIVWEETHEITAIGPQGITVRITAKGPTVDSQRTETWSAPGVVLTGAVFDSETDRFDPALIRYKFPLTSGETWRQSVRDLNKPPGPFGPIQRHVEVGGYESVATPAGTFDAIRMRIIMQLDDETVWQYPTQCNYVVWYAPAVGAMVKEDKRSHSMQKSGMEGIVVPGQYAIVELVSFSRGR